MVGALIRYSGYLLIFAGLALVISVVPSAAGPPDALVAAKLGPLPPISVGRGGAAVPLLIPNSRRAGITVPAPPTAVPTVPAAETPMGAPTPVVEPALPVAPPEPPAPATTHRIVIPRIGLDVKVVDVGVLPSGEMETASYAVGRLEFGAQAGEAGNLVLAGHNDVFGEVFRRLPEVQVGDELTTYRGDRPIVYRVEARTIVREDGATAAQRRENARWLEPTDDAVATLISCYPYRVDTHRIIVRARLVG